MKEQCLTWEIAKGKSGGRLTGQCPLQAVCNGEGCIVAVQKIEKPRVAEKKKSDEDFNLGLAGSLK